VETIPLMSPRTPRSPAPGRAAAAERIGAAETARHFADTRDRQLHRSFEGNLAERRGQVGVADGEAPSFLCPRGRIRHRAEHQHRDHDRHHDSAAVGVVQLLEELREKQFSGRNRQEDPDDDDPEDEDDEPGERDVNASRAVQARLRLDRHERMLTPWENVTNDFGYNPTVGRNVNVDIRHLLFMLQNVHSPELLKEIGSAERR
jgi:hypothetical protein